MEIDLLTLLIYIQMALYATITFFAFLYASIILCIRRFRETNNIFIANICLSITFTCSYFASYFPTMMTMYETPYLCVFYTYLFNLASIAVPYSFLAFSFHRYCMIIYHKNSLFKKKRWTIMCIAGLWTFQLIISLPFIGEYDEYCSMKIWMGYYTFITAVVIPLVIKSALDIRIFVFVRHSSRRVQPQAPSATTQVHATNSHQPRISSRDISLLKHMIFTFLAFLIGWTPVFLLNIIDAIIPGHIFQIIYCTYLSIGSTFCIVIYLFIYNRDLRQFLCNPCRRCCHL